MPGSKVDPALVACRTHVDRLRVELDRADTAAADYLGPGRDRLAGSLLDVRRQVDRVDKIIDTEAGGL